MAAWPEDPDAVIYPTDEEGKWIIYQFDRLKIVYWMEQANRIHEELANCPGVHFDSPEDVVLP